MAITKFDFDLSHSSVAFVARHLVFSKVRGTFGKWGGSLELDLADLTKSKVTVEIDTASIDTHEEKRDAHLRSPDFFDSEKFPKMTFVSKRIEKDGDAYRLVGDLTIRGVTKEVSLDTTFEGTSKDPWGGDRIAFSAATKIQRKDWGLNWNMALEAGGVLVGETVEIVLDIEAVQQKAAVKPQAAHA
jgi:polyisoprenoid-binding protein YceI